MQRIMDQWRVGVLVALLAISSSLSSAQVPEWGEVFNIEKTESGYRTTGDDPRQVTTTIQPAVRPEQAFLVLEMNTSAPTQCQIFWSLGDEPFGGNRHVIFHFPESPDEPARKVIWLGSAAAFKGLDQIRFDPWHHAGLEYEITRFDFVTNAELKPDELREQVEFKCISSKLHYQPGEPVPWRVSFFTEMFVEQEAAKNLHVRLLNDAQEVVAEDVQHVGLHPFFRGLRTIHGTLYPGDLKPGTYFLESEMIDMQTGERYAARHQLGVQGPEDPFVCETPFKFVKDFSIIQDREGVFHVFSITGDLIDKHAWQENGQERSLSHATSTDLRNWTWHAPVLSISDETYPDGEGMYESRNIWAPHVFEHDGTYYMFYTSVNHHVSQSISLATSKDLYNWEKHDNNPVLTLEDAEWADWRRDAWADNRDAVVIQAGDKFFMYTTARHKDGNGVVCEAESTDLLNWTNPTVAAKRHDGHAPESCQVWKMRDKYVLTANAVDAVSDMPGTGWTRTDWPLDPLPEAEKLVPTSANYANEVIELSDGSFLFATLTWRYDGNSIYIFKIDEDPETGLPAGTSSPFAIPEHSAEMR